MNRLLIDFGGERPLEIVLNDEKTDEFVEKMKKIFKGVIEHKEGKVTVYLNWGNVKAVAVERQ